MSSAGRRPMAEPTSVTRAQYAALRAWLQGMPIDVIAGRWLAHDPDDIPTEKTALAIVHDVRDAVYQRALLHGREDLASAISAPGRSGVSMDRAVHAVRELELLGTPAPKPEHAVGLWLARPFAKRLHAAGIATLADLVELCNARGASWWRRVPRIGPLAATSIVKVLQAYQTQLGALGPHVIGSRLPATYQPMQLHPGAGTALPLEAMRIPEKLDGSRGANRSSLHCPLDAKDDYAAINAWLSLWQTSPPTYRAYRKEAERFLAWVIIERQKALSDATIEDCIQYRAFLLDPQPAARWCGPRAPRDLQTNTPGLRLSNPAWRPFAGPLAPRSAKYSETVLSTLFSWLVRQHYLHSNPWEAIPALRIPGRRLQTDKAVPISVWAALSTWLDRLAPLTAHYRTMRAAIMLLAETGMRCDEAARADGSSMEQISSTADGNALHAVWGELRIVGKRSVERQVPISKRLYDALADHWRDRGLEAGEIPAGALISPVAAIDTPRAKAKRQAGRDGYSDRGLRCLVEKAYKEFRQHIEKEKPANAGLVQHFHPHSFRHAFATHCMAAGMSLEVIQGYMGHASLATLTLYTSADRDRRLAEVEKLFAGVRGQ